MFQLGDIIDFLWRSWAYISSGRTLAIILGAGCAILAIALFAASRTRWGKTKPLTKCIVLSVLAHVWLLMYAMGKPEILPLGNPRSAGDKLAVSFEGDASTDGGEDAPSTALSPPSLDDFTGKLSSEALLGEQNLDAERSSNASRQSVENAQQSDLDVPDPRPWEQLAPLEDLPKPEALESLLAELEQPLEAPDLLPDLQPTPLPPLPPLDEPAAAGEQRDEPVDSPDETRQRDGPEELAAAASSELPESLEVERALASEPVGESQETSSGVSSEAPPPNGETEATESLVSEPGITSPSVDSPAEVADESGSDSPGASEPQRTALPEPTTTRNRTERLPSDPLREREQLPREYRLRQAPDRARAAEAYGADQDTEAAVAAALQWLADAQSPDGSWNSQRFGGGTETYALGEYRFNTGAQADTGVSGLALLAFLSAGHTHLAGEYQKTMADGLSYLLRAQMPSGDLAGPKQIGSAPGVMNARMYCHGIAALAMAEAYAMTQDWVLREPLIRAGRYTVSAQDVRGGGWRYRPGDPGDLSQFGWQAMALNSIARSGIRVPDDVNRRMQRFLDACAAGQDGGLARYRPGIGRPSATMTAESLACRLLLGYPLDQAAQREAMAMLMSQLPTDSNDADANVYYWYYATLAIFQLQDQHWRVWNRSLKVRLLGTQQPAYSEQAGSWNPDGLWGGYGGRVYSTAMSCLCLEVYYRYLPMYQHTAAGRPHGAAR